MCSCVWHADVFGWSLDDEVMQAISAQVDEGFKASGSVNAQDIPWEDIK